MHTPFARYFIVLCSIPSLITQGFAFCSRGVANVINCILRTKDEECEEYTMNVSLNVFGGYVYTLSAIVVRTLHNSHIRNYFEGRRKKFSVSFMVLFVF